MEALLARSNGKAMIESTEAMIPGLAPGPSHRCCELQGVGCSQRMAEEETFCVPADLLRGKDLVQMAKEFLQ